MTQLKKEAKVSQMRLEGRFVGFSGKDREKPKRILVTTAADKYCVKISKNLRRLLPQMLKPGDWIEIAGKQKYSYKTGQLKLKADLVQLKARINPDPAQKVLPSTVAAVQKKASVILCQKSSCRKRGAGVVCEALKESLCDRGLTDRVTIQETGCMKQCNQGPCMVLMPDKARYTQVNPKDVSMLVEKHFAANC